MLRFRPIKKAMKTTSNKIKISVTIIINSIKCGFDTPRCGYSTTGVFLLQLTAEGIAAEFCYFNIYKATDF